MQNDLISRQAVIDLLQKNMSNDIQDNIITENNINLICSIPTAFSVEKVVEQLEEERKYYADFEKNGQECSPCLDAKYHDYFHRLERAVEIVKRGGLDG